jgi:hypothetical protein
MAINSKKKGKRGELEVVHFLKDRGYNARRGVQYKGTPDSPDVECEELNFLHFEVKRAESLNIEKALQQSISDAGENQIPVVVHRKNKEKWKVTLSFDDFLQLIKRKYRL